MGTRISIWLMLASPPLALGQDPASLPPAADRAIDFARDVRPILERHCLSCHGREKSKSGLRLDDPAAAHEGGDLFGPAVVPGESTDSPLLRLAAGLEPNLVMPPRKGADRTLGAEELSVIRAWIDQGAPWPLGSAPTPADAEEPLWALEPLERPRVPDRPAEEQAGNPIDRFLNEKMAERRLAPAARADRATLIRRLTFDLTGLPPSPEAIERFERDGTPDSYDRLVDRLLASPEYGERWARHWLDVAHYGESHGFGMDRPRLRAWPYRDYVVASLNADKPYGRFVEEQIAADALHPTEPSALPALGFVAAGPFNQSALVEQVDGTLCKLIALNLDRDDMVSSVASTFLSLTVHCARCHDHKFDPISQRDYYRLQAVFAGVARGERTFDADPLLHAKRRELLGLERDLESGKPLSPPSETELTRLASAREAWEREVLASLRAWKPAQGNAIATSGVTLIPQGDGSLLASGDSPDTDVYTFTCSEFPGGATALRLEVLPDEALPAKGPGRAENGNLHLTELRAVVVSEDGSESTIPLQRPTADFEQAGWPIAHAIDGNPATGWGIHPQEGRPHEAVIPFSRPLTLRAGENLRIVLEQKHGRRHAIGRFRLSLSDHPHPAVTPLLPPEVLAALQTPRESRGDEKERVLATHHRRLDLQHQLEALGEPGRVYAIGSEFPPLRNYKPPTLPVAIHVLKRGDVNQPRDEVVGPGVLACASIGEPDFSLPNPDDEAARRAALARWIADPANPLTWRSIANRIWHWHFGVGLVDTPNDFGRMGGKPSHPELLDWLACELRDRGGSTKHLHRLIVTTAAYQRTSEVAPSPEDNDNRLLARMTARRMDAEQLRDTLLVVAGRLDRTMGGPSVMQFVLRDPNPDVAPGIDYGAFDPDDPASSRRGIYRFLFRNVNDPLLEAFDAADPSLSTPRRNVTITPQQALVLWNDRLVLRTCEHLASRLQQSSPELGDQIDGACLLAWGRRPSGAEATRLAEHARRHGLAAACRLILNANDFLFIH